MMVKSILYGIFFLSLLTNSYARTRKPIPAGRFEALTGIKTSEATNVNEIGGKEIDSLWPKFNAMIKPQSKIYLSPTFTNLVFPPNQNIELTREKPEKGDFDSAILGSLSMQDEWLIKMLKRDGVLFVKTEINFKNLSATANSLGLSVLYYSKDTGEAIFKKE